MNFHSIEMYGENVSWRKKFQVNRPIGKVLLITCLISFFRDRKIKNKTPAGAGVSKSSGFVLFNQEEVIFINSNPLPLNTLH